MALMAQTTAKFHGSATSAQREDKWRQSLAQRIASTSFNSHTTTSLLCHLSAAVSNGLALPPYLSPFFGLAQELEDFNPSLVDIRNANNASFTAFASLEVLNAVVSQSLTKIIRYGSPTALLLYPLLKHCVAVTDTYSHSEMKLLVGEIKFEGATNEVDH